MTNIYRHYKGGLYWLMCEAIWCSGHAYQGAFRHVTDARWHEDPAPKIFVYIVATGDQVGTFYATMLASDPRKIDIADGTPVMVYQDVGTGRVYVRPKKEWDELIDVTPMVDTTSAISPIQIHHLGKTWVPRFHNVNAVLFGPYSRVGEV